MDPKDLIIWVGSVALCVVMIAVAALIFVAVVNEIRKQVRR